jgi:hypothetical protein
MNVVVSGIEFETPFDAWLHELEFDVIIGEYGYEEGEFSVFPSGWKHMWEEGLTPLQAWKRALEAHKQNDSE